VIAHLPWPGPAVTASTAYNKLNQVDAVSLKIDDTSHTHDVAYDSGRRVATVI
jgi:hypothetical protein